jgi:uncharacterized repeat protein (TIGR01451 family)
MGKRLGALIGAVVTLIFVGPGGADAATFDVDSTPDVTHAAPNCTPAPDACSIRDAFATASALANPDAANTISIPAGDFKLTAGDVLFAPPAAQTTVTVDGAGARETIIHGVGDRAFSFQGISATVTDLTITDGAAGVASSPGANDGRAIYIESTGGDVLNLGSVTLRGNTATMAGGAVSAPPHSAMLVNAIDINITDSTISGNTVTGGGGSGQGGGIQAFGDLSVTNSTIAGNRVENPGLSMGAGVVAAVWVSGGSVSLINSTIAGNSISDPTGSGAGIATVNPTMGAAGTITATNTIVSGNTVAGSAGDCGLVGTVTSDNNLSSDSSCQFTDDGSFQATDPGLAELADYGGPTDTLAFGFDSAAYNGGAATGCPAADQRGITRPQGPACDIGAVEIVPPPEQLPPPPPPAAKSADLGVSLTADPERPEPGKKVKFSFEVTNAGPDAATSTVLTGKLPGRASKVKHDGCKVSKRGKKYRLRCDLGTLDSGASDSLSVKVKPTKGLRKPRATVQAASAVADPNTANNQAKKKITVERE